MNTFWPTILNETMKYFSLLLIFIITACTQVGAFVANVPGKFNELPVAQNISYGDGDMNKLDVYGTDMPDAPVIVFIHGGSWQIGNKELYQFVGDRFAGLGYVVVIPDYRKYPAVKYPVFVEEGAAVMQWTFDNIADYGGNPKNVFIMGFSAGAHTGAMLAANESYGVQDKIDGFIGLAGPYDFVPEAEDIKAIFSDVPVKQMQVTTFIDGTETPMLLLHGKEDESVRLSNLEKLAAGIKAKNGSVQTKIYDDLDHVDMVKVMTWLFNDKAPVAEDIDGFIKQITNRAE